MKKFRVEEVPGSLSWSHFFLILGKLSSKFLPKILVTILRDIIGLENSLLSFSQSSSRITMCNLHWRYTFCTGVTLFVLVLQLNRTALSQSESSNFLCILLNQL